MTSRLALATLALALIFAPTGAARAQTQACDGLDGARQALARSVLASQHPYDCCDDTIARCLETHPSCTLPRRLADHVCRLARGGADEATIVRALERRALTMMKPGRTWDIDLKDAPIAGCTKAKVELVAYLCARCPFCSKLLPKLHRETTRGRLAGKVALHVRLFPIKGHDGSTEANIAVAAAQHLGRFWDYLLYAYRHFDDFSPDVLDDWAVAVGLDRDQFEEAAKLPDVRAQLVASKREGLRNEVGATPTLFLNGRRYVADLDFETILDLVEEELEHLSQ